MLSNLGFERSILGAFLGENETLGARVADGPATAHRYGNEALDLILETRFGHSDILTLCRMWLLLRDAQVLVDLLMEHLQVQFSELSA